MISKYILDTLDCINTLINGKRILDIPADIRYSYDLPYGGHCLEKFDIFINQENSRFLIVNIHGGGFLSGEKNGVRQFSLELCKMHCAVINLNYPLPRTHLHPSPINSLFKAYTAAIREYPELAGLGVILTGDSAGSYFASYAASAICDEELAKRQQITPLIPREKLKGLLLYCGIYEIKTAYNTFPRIIYRDMIREYFGKKGKYFHKEDLTDLSPLNHCGKFPKVFLASSDGDWLNAQYKLMKDKLTKEGVELVSFYAGRKDMHDYQLNLNSEAARKCMAATVEFIDKL